MISSVMIGASTIVITLSATAIPLHFNVNDNVSLNESIAATGNEHSMPEEILLETDCEKNNSPNIQ
jgi:hypothetical protein